MSNASNRNFGAAARERERLIASDLESPGNFGIAQGQYLGPGWQALYGALHDKAEEAAANGMGFRADLSGIGSEPGGALPRPGDADTARSNAVNAYLGQLADQNAVKAQSLLAMTAGADIAQTQAGQAERDLRDRDALDRSLAPPYAPTTVTREIGPDGKTHAITMRPAGPVDSRQMLLNSVPGHMRPALEQTLAAMDERKAAAKLAQDKEAEAIRHNKATEPGAVGTSVSDEGVELAARNYLTTGQMPPLGMGDKTTRQRILDRAGQLGGSGASISANKADYGANSESLKKMQTQRDAIGAFENTAGKNIDIFLDAAGKVVDTGSPLANTLARQVTGKMLGSPDQAKYDAARQVAINEIAKITSNPTLSGQLSDSARHEVEAFNPQGATLAQTVAVMRLLKQDMGNRVGSLDTQLADIRGRLAPKKVTPAPAGFVDMVDPDGHPLHVPAGDVAKLLKLGAKQKGGG